MVNPLTILRNGLLRGSPTVKQETSELDSLGSELLLKTCLPGLILFLDMWGGRKEGRSLCLLAWPFAPTPIMARAHYPEVSWVEEADNCWRNSLHLFPLREPTLSRKGDSEMRNRKGVLEEGAHLEWVGAGLCGKGHT